MLCLVQNIQQAKEKTSKSRKLPFMRRRKTIPSVTEHHDENFLHPDIARETPRAFWHRDKQGHLSGSAPSMTCAPLDLALTPSTCRSRQKKFLRHFKVDPDERVIDYYSCALVADILLQGHLYISKNYFAFYSNVFGYITKLLIPTPSVVNVTKEKTAFILPNAVGVVTTDDRHVFSSLLSRDTTYRLMVQVWQAAHISRTPDITNAPETEVDGSVCEELSTPSSSELVFEINSTANGDVSTLPDINEPILCSSNPVPTIKSSSFLYGLPRSTLLLAASTILLIGLFVSASVLMYRLSQLQHSLSTQHCRGSRSLYEIQEYLDTNLNNLNKVRQSLEVLSLLMESEKDQLIRKKVENQFLEKLEIKDTVLLTAQVAQKTEELEAS